MADLPSPDQHNDIVLTNFIVSQDIERSVAFYTGVLDGEIAMNMEGGPAVVQLANGWIVINVGGGPTDDKPEITLDVPTDPTRASAFLNIRVADLHAIYAEWSALGASSSLHPSTGARAAVLPARSGRTSHRGRTEPALTIASRRWPPGTAPSPTGMEASGARCVADGTGRSSKGSKSPGARSAAARAADAGDWITRSGHVRLTRACYPRATGIAGWLDTPALLRVAVEPLRSTQENPMPLLRRREPGPQYPGDLRHDAGRA